MPVVLNVIETTVELGQTNVEVVLESASEPGPAGPGVPTGGTINQVLTKDSATDFDTSWQDAQGGAGGGAPTDATYLVTTAHADLSAEVPVGATPQGELGGTWASPTVDATHSGSSHASVQAAAEATAAAALAAHAGAADPHTGYRLESVAIAAADVAADVATQAELDAHINDATAAHAGAAVSVDSTALSGTAITVQGSLEELDNLLDDHSARHENGGADEISLAGLDGTPTALQTHLDDATAAHAASAISADSTTLVGTGTDVQAVLEELDNGIADHLADAADAHDASAISFTPAGTIAATDVQAAITEVASEAGAVAFLGARVHHNANQAITTNTATALAFNSERYDTNTLHDTATNNSRLTVPASQGGKYLVGANLEFEALGVAAFRQVGLRVNGATTIAIQSNTQAGTLRINLGTVYDLAAADYVEVTVYHEVGSNTNVVAAGNFSPEFWMHKVG